MQHSLFNRYRFAVLQGLCAILVSGFTGSVYASGLDLRARTPTTLLAIRHVNFRIGPGVLLHIVQIHGELVPLEISRPPTFDDKRSFGISMQNGTIALSTGSLAALLNDYVFAYSGTPIRDVKMTNHNGELVQSGSFHRIPVTMIGKLGVTSEGLIRFTPDSIKMAGVSVKTLMDALGTHSQKIAHPDESRGFKFAGDDQLLNINQFPISPRLYGHVVGIRLEGDNVIVTFASDAGGAKSSQALEPPVARLAFIYFRGGTVSFGKLTMDNTELEIVPARREEWLDFDLDHYNDQLTAGCAETTPSFALIVSVPDYKKGNEK